MTSKISFLSLILVLTITSSCNAIDNQELVNEYGGSARYLINNKTDKNLVLIFQQSEELGSVIDTTDVISMNTSAIIFEDFMLGNNPTPIHSFEEIKFYEASDLTSPISIISPIENGRWRITAQDLDQYGLGLTVFEFTYTE